MQSGTFFVHLYKTARVMSRAMGRSLDRNGMCWCTSQLVSRCLEWEWLHFPPKFSAPWLLNSLEASPTFVFLQCYINSNNQNKSNLVLMFHIFFVLGGNFHPFLTEKKSESQLSAITKAEAEAEATQKPANSWLLKACRNGKSCESLSSWF